MNKNYSVKSRPVGQTKGKGFNCYVVGTFEDANKAVEFLNKSNDGNTYFSVEQEVTPVYTADQVISIHSSTLALNALRSGAVSAAPVVSPVAPVVEPAPQLEAFTMPE